MINFSTLIIPSNPVLFAFVTVSKMLSSGIRILECHVSYLLVSVDFIRLFNAIVLSSFLCAAFSFRLFGAQAVPGILLSS
jgi:hypothetical protein